MKYDFKKHIPIILILIVFAVSISPIITYAVTKITPETQVNIKSKVSNLDHASSKKIVKPVTTKNLAKTKVKSKAKKSSPKKTSTKTKTKKISKITTKKFLMVNAPLIDPNNPPSSPRSY